MVAISRQPSVIFMDEVRLYGKLLCQLMPRVIYLIQCFLIRPSFNQYKKYLQKKLESSSILFFTYIRAILQINNGNRAIVDSSHLSHLSFH